VVVDSLVFEWLPEVRLLDYNEQTEELLLTTQNEIMVIDNEGEIVSQFNPHIEGPSYVGNSDFGWIFDSRGGLICYAHHSFDVLDKAGNRIKRIPYPTEVKYWMILDFNPQMLFNYKVDGAEKLVVMIPAPIFSDSKSKAFQDSVELIYSIDVKTDEARSVMAKTEDNVYRNLEAYVDPGWPYMTNFSDGKFAQVFNADSVIYVWDAEKNRLINTLSIPVDSRPDYQTIPFGDRGEPDRYKVNANVYSTGDYIILNSINLIPESIYKEIRKLPRWWESEELASAQRKYSKNEYLIFDEEGFLGNLEMNIGKVDYYQLSTKSDFLWYQRTYEDERDYRTFLKVKIVPVEE